jgi:hypothetical protein
VARLVVVGLALSSVLVSCAPQVRQDPDCTFTRGFVARLSRIPPPESDGPVQRVREHESQMPIVRLSQRPSSERSAEPRFDLAVFDDGVVIYSGHRCVRRPGVAVDQLTSEGLRGVKELVSSWCRSRPAVAENELCVEGGTVREVLCSDGEHVQSATDRCRRDPAADEQLAAFADQLVQRLDAQALIGGTSQWRACAPATPAIAPASFAPPR